MIIYLVFINIFLAVVSQFFSEAYKELKRDSLVSSEVRESPPVPSGHTPPNKANVRNLCPCRICTGTGLDRPTSVPGLGSPLPHLHRDRARPCHICTAHLQPLWAHPRRICTGTGPA